MSAADLFRGLKKPKSVPPRSLEEINKDYSETVFKAGQSQYQIYVHEKDLAEHNQKLLRLNQEAYNRNELDKKAAPEAPKSQEEEVQS